MSEIQHPNAPINELHAKFEEVGVREFERLVKTGEVPSLTNQFLRSYAYKSIKDTCDRIPEDKLIEINVPKLTAEGKNVMKDGYVETEKRHVFERQHVRKTLLTERKLSEKEMKAWESENS